MLRVRCFETELAENGDVIGVGDVVKRMAVRHPMEHFGTEIDALWGFDSYGGPPDSEVITLTGEVTAIDAVYVELTADADGGWRPRLRSARLEPLHSTADTVSPLPTILWETPSPPDPTGHSYGTGYAIITEGDTSFAGWVVTLQDEVSTPAVSPGG
ncbi:hypothetical protein [Naasia lichenicola]|uniref:Uncharacterized protein n=1 Tax=Naasia lichenicola TaxID=2565933 RepID=A0A4S4FF09_9MICO|nr:hypothetical protein [Naasia lichenicola]THG28154.1 hypothetical protein E6C64_18770 [Naasia lichenicola]